MEELLTGSGILILYFLICASSALLLHFFVRVPDEVFRKLLHLILLGSLCVWLLVFSSWQLSVLSAVAFALAVYPLLALAEHIKGYSQLLTERKSGELKHSLLVVFAMYAVVACVCWGWLDDKLLALASIYAWGPGDAAAALIGKRFGRHPLKWKGLDGRKSAEGTAAMFLTSFFTVLILLCIRGGLPLPGCVTVCAATAAVTALTELYTPNGMDTITCPLAAMTVLLPLTALFGGSPL